MRLLSIVRQCLLFALCVSSTAHASGLRMMAASSLTDVLSEVGRKYERDSGQEAPQIAFAGSSRLARQVLDGAGPDIVATASPEWMDVLEAEGMVVAATRRHLLKNHLVVAVPSGSESDAHTLSDLTQPGFRRVGISSAAVPAGAYARESLRAAGVLEALSSRFIVAPDVRATLSLGASDEADAVIVYRTDADIEPGVRTLFEVNYSTHSPIVYPFALTPSGSASDEAKAFFDYLSGPSARAVFIEHGFGVSGSPDPAGAVKPSVIAAPEMVSAGPPLALSIQVAVISLLLSIIPAIGLGWLLARREFFGKSLLSTICLAPLALPPVVTGYLLLRCFGRSGWFAPLLDVFGIQIAFTRWAAVIAAAVVGFPLLLILVRQAIEGVDVRYGQLAQTLGLQPWRAFLRVTLPMALPGIAAGCVLAFARALGEFGATAMVAGDQPGETRTLALAVYSLAERPGGEDAALTLVWVSLGVSLIALWMYERLVWRQRRLKGER